MVLLAKTYDPEKIDPKGWILSEKLDGVRAYWDGTSFVSRTKHDINAPKWFTEDFPSIPMDGELWIARQSFQKTISIVRKKIPIDEEWKNITFMVFDLPSIVKSYTERIKEIPSGRHFKPVTTWTCKGHDHLMKELEKYSNGGAEGLMLRNPTSFYENKRSSTLYKVKKMNDAEATVVGSEDGRGKHKGRMGALWVLTKEGIKFKIGTGFSDAERENPPKIGDKITYRYTELTKDGVPKFASFLRKFEEL